jgi:hypothetical protein
MDPVTLTTATTFNQPNYDAEAPIGHPREDQTTRQLAQDQAARRLEHRDADTRYPVNTFAPPSSSLDQPRAPVDDIPQQGMCSWVLCEISYSECLSAQHQLNRVMALRCIKLLLERPTCLSRSE